MPSSLTTSRLYSRGVRITGGVDPRYDPSRRRAYIVVGFLQQWLDLRFAENLRELTFEQGLRIAVLLASTDGPALATTRTLEEKTLTSYPVYL
jgi:hypothetical protein